MNELDQLVNRGGVEAFAMNGLFTADLFSEGCG
jgi:hypothetical protein